MCQTGSAPHADIPEAMASAVVPFCTSPSKSEANYADGELDWEVHFLSVLSVLSAVEKRFLTSDFPDGSDRELDLFSHLIPPTAQ
jgi:hypothetical protein